MEDYIEKSVELQDEISDIHDKVKKLQIKTEEIIPDCPICHDKVMLPVRLVNENNEYCPFSEKNPTCLFCIKYWIKHCRNNIRAKCIAGCCHIIDMGQMTYGEIERSIPVDQIKECDIPEKKLWEQLGSAGITKCRRCDVECDTIINLNYHIRRECIHRCILCKLCNQIIPYLDMDEHKKICYGTCIECGDKISADKETGEIIHTSECIVFSSNQTMRIC